MDFFVGWGGGGVTIMKKSNESKCNNQNYCYNIEKVLNNFDYSTQAFSLSIFMSCTILMEGGGVQISFSRIDPSNLCANSLQFLFNIFSSLVIGFQKSITCFCSLI